MTKPIRICWLLLLGSLPVLSRAQKAGDPQDDYHRCQVTILMGSQLIPATVYEYGSLTTKDGKIKLAFAGNLFKLSVPYRSKYSFTLPNGTAIFLNSGSRLLFNPTDNYMEISGEGYFQFTRNTSIISCSKGIIIKGDSGSCVNVKCYNDYPFEPLVTTTLIKGPAVKVVSGDELISILTPGNQLSINKTLLEKDVSRHDTSETLSWTTDAFNYTNIDPYLVIARLGRWYGKNVEFADAGPRKVINFIGSYKASLHESLDRLMEETDAFSFLTGEDYLTVRKEHLVK